MMMSSSSKRCAACKHLRRRCPSDCIFSPYFPPDNPRRFSYVHKIYGASNVAHILQGIPEHRRAEAADSMYYEAYCRVRDPVYGCVGIITILNQEIYNAQSQLATIQAHIAALAPIPVDHHQVDNDALSWIDHHQANNDTLSWFD